MPIFIENNIKLYRFPNGVSFRSVLPVTQDSVAFFCEDCERTGYRWHTEFSLLEAKTSNFDYKEMVLSRLIEHAELHNPLCKRFEKMLQLRGAGGYNVTPTASMNPYYFSFYPGGEESIPKPKPRPKRKIQLRKIDVITGEEE